MSSTDFALAVEDLTVSFDGFKAIDDLTLYDGSMSEWAEDSSLPIETD